MLDNSDVPRELNSYAPDFTHIGSRCVFSLFAILEISRDNFIWLEVVKQLTDWLTRPLTHSLILCHTRAFVW
jgi:hypothetical protein